LLEVSVELPPVCSAAVRQGRLGEDGAALIAERVRDALRGAGTLDASQLCIREGTAVWCAFLDVCCLCADGALIDAALLAAVGALANLELPAVAVSEKGVVVPADAVGEGEDAAMVSEGGEARALELGPVPFALTSGVAGGRVLVDPTAEEEAVLEAAVAVAFDESERCVGMLAPAALGAATAAGVSLPDAALVRSLEAAKLRRAELAKVLADAQSPAPHTNNR